MQASVERQGCCFDCDSSTHNVKECRGPFKCAICKGLASNHRLGTALCRSLVGSTKNRQGSNVGGINLANNER